MNDGRRLAFLGASVAFAVAAYVSGIVWHVDAFAPMAVYLAGVCFLALFERGRYRAAPVPASTHWQSTGERFFDPVSGARTEVFYDPLTGAREYRVS